MAPPQKSKLLIFTYVALILGVASLGLGIFYFTTDTRFLADDFGRHRTHGIAATGFGIALIVAGIIVWQRAKREKSP